MKPGPPTSLVHTASLVGARLLPIDQVSVGLVGQHVTAPRTAAMVDELHPPAEFVTRPAAQARAVDHETCCHVRALRTADATDCSADRSGNVPKSGP